MLRGQSIHAYFDGKAAEYDSLSGRGLWAKVRVREGQELASLLGPLNGTELLDLGCGSGHYSTWARARGARVFGVDSSPRMIEELRKKGIEGRCADVATLALGRRFPVILAAGVIEFVEDERGFFEVARSHCESGGRLVLLAPRAGLVGKAYELSHAWMGCAAVARPVAELEAAAGRAGWKLDTARGAGPLAVALRFIARGEVGIG